MKIFNILEVQRAFQEVRWETKTNGPPTHQNHSGTQVGNSVCNNLKFTIPSIYLGIYLG